MEVYMVCLVLVTFFCSVLDGVCALGGGLRDRRGLQSWEASLKGRNCAEVTELCDKSLTQEGCVIGTSTCYEKLKCSDGHRNICKIEWDNVLKAYDREIFAQVQAVMGAFFAMTQEDQQRFVDGLTGSVREGGAESIVGRTVETFDSLARILPLVEQDLSLKFNTTAWDDLSMKMRQSPGDLLGSIQVSEMTGFARGSGEGGGASNELMSELMSVFILPEDFSLGTFLSTIQWDKGLLENLGMNDDSFAKVVKNLSEDEGGLENLATDLSLLVNNASNLRKAITAQ